MRYRITLQHDETTTVIEWESGGSWRFETEDEFTRYYWEEGNFSCDCNRAQYFGLDDGFSKREGFCTHTIKLLGMENLTTLQRVELTQ